MFISLVLPKLTNLCYFILLATITVSRSPQIRYSIFHFETEKIGFIILFEPCLFSFIQVKTFVYYSVAACTILFYLQDKKHRQFQILQHILKNEKILSKQQQFIK